MVKRAAGSDLSLRLITDSATLRALKLGTALSAGTIAVAGFAGPAQAQTTEEACAFIVQLRSPYTIERVLQNFPNDPCIPVMLTSIRPDLLSRVSRDVILSLPTAQLDRLPAEVRDRLGLNGQTRSIGQTTQTTRPTQTTRRPVQRRPASQDYASSAAY
jgi:hypothetical protein